MNAKDNEVTVMAARFLVMLAINSGLALMYYLWQWEGVSQAGDVFMFMVWFSGIAGLLVIFATADAKYHKPKLPGHAFLSAGFTIAFAVGAIWAGNIVAAVFYVIGILFVRAHHDKCKELAEGASS